MAHSLCGSAVHAWQDDARVGRVRALARDARRRSSTEEPYNYDCDNYYYYDYYNYYNYNYNNNNNNNNNNTITTTTTTTKY